MPVRYSPYRETYVQYQLGDAKAQIQFGRVPTAAIPLQTITLYIIIKNVGQEGRIFANLVGGGGIVVSSVSKDMGAGETNTFALTTRFPNALAAMYYVSVGHTIAPGGVIEDIPDDRSETFTIKRLTLTIEGIAAPFDATDAIILDMLIPLAADIDKEILSRLAPVVLQFQGLSLIDVSIAKNGEKMILWVKSPLAPAVAAAVIALVKLALIVVAIVVVAYTVKSLLSGETTLQTVVAANKLIDDANDAKQRINSNPNLTAAEKAQRIAAIDTQVTLALELAKKQQIPWKWLIGGTVAAAVVVGGAMILSKPDARTFVASRIPF